MQNEGAGGCGEESASRIKPFRPPVFEDYQCFGTAHVRRGRRGGKCAGRVRGFSGRKEKQIEKVKKRVKNRLRGVWGPRSDTLILYRVCG